MGKKTAPTPAGTANVLSEICIDMQGCTHIIIVACLLQLRILISITKLLPEITPEFCE